jgi:hypothetical protein
MQNQSDLRFEVEKGSSDSTITLGGRESATLVSKKRVILKICNFEIAPGRYLEVEE